MGSVKRAVKKIARPKVLLPLAVIGTGGAALGAFGPAAKAAMVGSAGAGANVLPALHGVGAAIPGTAATKGILGGLLGTGGKLSTVGKGILGAGALGSAAAMMGSPKTEEQKTLGVDPQAQYNLMRLMNEKMGGAYTDEELNILAAPQLSMYGGEYQTITGPKRKRRPMFEGLNYSGLTRLVPEFAEGGSIKPKKRKDAVEEMAKESEQREIIMDALFDSTRPGMNEDLIAERMFDAMRRQELNPMGRAMGGRIGLANGGDLKYAVESFIRDFPEFENLESKELYKEMEKRGYLSDRDEMKNGGIMQMAMSDPSPDAERSDMLEDMALKRFGKPLSSLTDVQVIELEEDLQELIMEKMAKGGSVPQTESIPNGMQIDGRGGGFIPMGARERKDDVPAMLAKNEFVMTADAVRAAGGGDVNKGAQRMYDLMNSLESKV